MTDSNKAVIDVEVAEVRQLLRDFSYSCVAAYLCSISGQALAGACGRRLEGRHRCQLTIYTFLHREFARHRWWRAHNTPRRMCYMRRNIPILAILGALRGIANSPSLAHWYSHSCCAARVECLLVSESLVRDGPFISKWNTVFVLKFRVSVPILVPTS